MTSAPPSPAAPSTDPCPEISEWVRDNPDAGLFDHERSDDDETAEGDANALDEVQGEDDSDEDHQDGDAPGDEQGEAQGDEGDEPDSDEPDDDDHQGDEADPDELPDLPGLPLDEATVDDPDAISWAVDEVIATDAAARAVQRRVIEQQGVVQQQLTPCQWAEVLALEELVTARWSDLMLVVARWAWHEGRRVGREEG